jgi:hypothetical protein
VVAWLADLDAAEARLGLHDRALTQLELGEPVHVTGRRRRLDNRINRGIAQGPAAEGLAPGRRPTATHQP